MRLEVQQLRAAFRLLAERNNRGAVRAGVRREPFELLIARRQDSGPALLQAFEDFRLRVRDIGERVEELDVDGGNPGDDGKCGRTRRVSGVISPAWFMPISNTPKRLLLGMRASDSGTPQRLL